MHSDHFRVPVALSRRDLASLCLGFRGVLGSGEPLPDARARRGQEGGLGKDQPVQFFSGSTTGKVVQDSSLHTGKQTVALKNELASVLLVNGAAYITGNSRG